MIADEKSLPNLVLAKHFHDVVGHLATPTVISEPT